MLGVGFVGPTVCTDSGSRPRVTDSMLLSVPTQEYTTRWSGVRIRKLAKKLQHAAMKLQHVRRSFRKPFARKGLRNLDRAKRHSQILFRKLALRRPDPAVVVAKA